MQRSAIHACFLVDSVHQRSQASKVCQQSTERGCIFSDSRPEAYSPCRECSRTCKVLWFSTMGVPFECSPGQHSSVHPSCNTLVRYRLLHSVVVHSQRRTRLLAGAFYYLLAHANRGEGRVLHHVVQSPTCPTSVA